MTGFLFAQYSIDPAHRRNRIAAGEAILTTEPDAHRHPVLVPRVWVPAPDDALRAGGNGLALRRHRILLPVDGFSLAKTVAGTLMAFFYRPYSGNVLQVAAYRDGQTAQVLSVPSNALIKPFSARMPVLLDEAGAALWLDPMMDDLDRLAPLVKAAPVDLLTNYRIGEGDDLSALTD